MKHACGIQSSESSQLLFHMKLIWYYIKFKIYVHSIYIGRAGHGSSIGNVSAWHASGPDFDPHVRHILLWRLGHENISTAILPLPLIQKEQLSVTGERMCTKYW